MKKTLTLLVLVLAMLFAVGVAAQADTPDELLGKWKAVGGDYEPTEGVEQYFVFTETEMTTLAVYYGEEYAETMPYTIEGNAVVAEDYPVNFELDGDTLTMWDDEMTIIFTRVTDEAGEATAVPAELLGKWKAVGGDYEPTEGVEQYFVFDETEMTMLAVYYGEEYAETEPYTIEGNAIVAEGYPVNFEVDGDTLTMWDDEMTIIFTRVTDEAGEATAVPAELLGKWQAVGGDYEPTEGVEEYFVFTETEMTMLAVYYGEEYAETEPYTIEGNAIVAEGYPVNFELDGDTLTMWDDEMTIIFARVTDEAGEATAVPAELLGKWQAVGGDYVPYEGMEDYFVFTETELTSLTVYLGEEYASTEPYTIEGNAVILDGYPVNFEVDGDTLTMWDDTETIVFVRVGSEAAVPADASILLGEWKLVGAVDEEMDAMLPEDYEAYFVFTETEMTATVVVDGEESSMSAEYTVEGNRLVQDVSYMTWQMDGETLILTEDGIALRFERVSGGLVGEWDVIEILGDEDGTMSLALIRTLGGTMRVIFTETQMTLEVSVMGESEIETTEYTIADGMLYNPDGTTLAFELDGDRLILGNEDDGMVLQRVGTTAEETVIPAEGPLGEWTMTDVTGDEEAAASFQLLLLLGANIDLTITENTATLTMEIMGESEAETIGCTIIGDIVYLEDGTTCQLVGDELHMSEEDVTLVFVRK